MATMTPVRRIAGSTRLFRRPAPIDDDATRRDFLIGGLSLAALLAGCTGPTTDAPPTTGSAGFPRTVAGKEGTATIPTRPGRVITVGFQRDTDTVLALGVMPTAMVKHALFPSGLAPWVEAATPGPKPRLLEAADGLPFEAIAGLRPDLIVATDDYELADNYARLAQIAPTVSYVDGVESDTWQQRTTHIGTALGRDEQARRAVSDIEAQVARAAEANPVLAGKVFSRYYVSEGEVRAITRGDASVALLEQLGLKISPEVDAQPRADTPGRASVSMENLGVLDAEVMIVSYPTPADRTFLESSPVFQQLDAVKNGRYVQLDHPVAVALGFPSALSIPYGLGRTVTAIANALR